jgi:hypothetical protein
MQSSVECRRVLTEVVILNLEVFSHDEKDFPSLRVHVHVTDAFKEFIKSECYAMNTVRLIYYNAENMSSHSSAERAPSLSQEAIRVKAVKMQNQPYRVRLTLT